MSYKLKKINTYHSEFESMYLYTGHGEPIVSDMKRATLAHLHYTDKIEANKIKSNELSAYSLFIIPPHIEIIFFNKLGQSHDANPCDFEHAIINTNIMNIRDKFNRVVRIEDDSSSLMTSMDKSILTMTTLGKEKMNYTIDDNSDLGDIAYVRYVGGMRCADLEMNMTDNVLEYGREGPAQYYEKYQKVGLYKYPLNPNDFFKNECSNDIRLGLTTEHIYLTDLCFAHFHDKYDESGSPIINNNIDREFHLHYIPTLLDIHFFDEERQALRLQEVTNSFILNFFNNDIDHDTIKQYQVHLSSKQEQYIYKEKSLQGAINVDSITKFKNNEAKTTLKDICDYLSHIDKTSKKIILLVVTCRGDADMIHDD